MIHPAKNTELAFFHLINNNPGRMDSMLTRFPIILLLAMCLSSTGHVQQEADKQERKNRFEKNVWSQKKTIVSIIPPIIPQKKQLISPTIFAECNC